MLRIAAGRFTSSLAGQPLQIIALTRLKVRNQASNLRCLSITSTTRQKTGVTEAGVIAAAPQVASTTVPSAGDSLTEKIVDISAASDVTISQIAEGLSTDLLTASGIVPTLQDMGLGSYWPSGRLQIVLDFLHSSGLPWWASIACVTIVMKTLLIPFVLKGQRNTAAMMSVMPEFQKLQIRLSEAKNSGNLLEASKISNEMTLFMKDKNFNPLNSLKPTLIQAPVFISFFYALRQMANLPVESFKTGGILWFTDLTVPDPYYVLPVMTCLTVYIIVETGAEATARADKMAFMKYALRAMPFIMFPVIMNFPTAILCYWSVSNLYSLGQVMILKHPALRKRLNIPSAKKHEKRDLPLSKGFIQDMKDGYSSVRLAGEINDRARSDEIRFKDAATGRLVKTFKHPQKLKQTAKN